MPNIENLPPTNEGRAEKLRRRKEELQAQEFETTLEEKVAGYQKEKRQKAMKGLREKLKAPEKEKRRKEMQALREQLKAGEYKKAEESQIVEAETIGEIIDLEDKWAAEGEKPEQARELDKVIVDMRPEELREALDVQGKNLQEFYRESLDALNPDIGWGDEYVRESNQLVFVDGRRETLENELWENFHYDAGRGGWWSKFNIRRKLDPEEVKQFDKLTLAYKNLSTEYDHLLKKHTKRWTNILNLVTPSAKRRFYKRDKHPELGPPRLW